MKQKNFSDAKTLVFSGALELLKHSQYGSGFDLAMLLLELYQNSDTPVNDDTACTCFMQQSTSDLCVLGPLVELAKLFPLDAENAVQVNDLMDAVVKYVFLGNFLRAHDKMVYEIRVPGRWRPCIAS